MFRQLQLQQQLYTCVSTICQRLLDIMCVIALAVDIVCSSMEMLLMVIILCASLHICFCTLAKPDSTLQSDKHVLSIAADLGQFSS